MSLTVCLNRFKTLKTKSSKIASLCFRDYIQYSDILDGGNEIIEIYESFYWAVTTPIKSGEVLTVKFFVRSRWSSPRVIGVYRLGLHVIVTDGTLNVVDALVDDDNQVVPVYVDMKIEYEPPMGFTPPILRDLTPRVDQAGEQQPELQEPEVHGPEVHKPKRHQPEVHKSKVHLPEVHKPKAYKPKLYEPITFLGSARRARIAGKARAASVEEIGEASGQASGAASGQAFGAVSRQAFGAASGQASGSASGQASGAVSRQGSSAASGQVLGSASGKAYGAVPKQASGAASGQAYGAVPKQASGAVSGQAYGAVPKQASGAASGQAYGAVSRQAFGAASGQASGSASGQASGAVSRQGSSAASGQVLGSVSGQAYGAVPKQASGQAYGAVPKQASSAASGQASDSALGKASGAALGQATGAVSGKAYGAVPKHTSSAASRQSYGVVPKQASGGVSSQAYGAVPKQASGSPSGQASGAASGQTSGSASGKASGAASGQAYGAVSRQAHATGQAAGLGSTHSSDIEEEFDLENIEQNINTLEESLQITEAADLEPGGQSRTRKIKDAGKRLLRKGLSMGHDKVVMINEKETKHTPKFRNMKSFMRFGRRSGSANTDEEHGLLHMAGPSTEYDPFQTGFSEPMAPFEDMAEERQSPMDTPRKRRIRMACDATGPAALKAADFQICVTVLEARQLAGLNMDPVVCVQVGDNRRLTSIKESTNCPYFNEYFVFDFHMPPVMLFDKMITLSVLQSRNILRSDKLLGSFKLDVATVWNQPDRQFYHKWAMLTDPNDIAGGPKGYLKCDICVVGKGDSIKVPSSPIKDPDDIEANLLLPDGVSVERQRARFIVTIYKADGLPKMNYSIFSNVKKAFTGETQDLVDPYVQVCFAGMKGCTSVKKNCYTPVWNEQIVFSEMFPPLCQRIKIQLRDNHPVQPNVIGTHFIDLKSISNDGERGFLPTFGPAYIYVYGSTRDYSLIDQHSDLNMGMGEGVSYRARVLMSIRTEIVDNIEYPMSEVEVEPAVPVNEGSFEKNQEFFLFGAIFDANMIDKRLVDKPIQFELSIGNTGNNIDGPNESLKKPQDLIVENPEELTADTGYWQSVTYPTKAVSSDKTYYYLPYWDTKQCMHVRSIWPDHRRRMYNSNQIADIIDKFEEALLDVQMAVEADSGPENTNVAAMKSTLDLISNACAAYVKRMINAPALGNTKLDRERQKMCLHEIEHIGIASRNLRALITKSSIKDRLCTAFGYLNKLKNLCEDAQQAMPDIFIWMISNGKRLAYYRIPARDLIYSDSSEEKGKFCGKMQTIFLKWPGKKASSPSGWAIPAMIRIYLWIGALQDKRHYIDGLPPGYDLSPELKNADIPHAFAPHKMFYLKKHNFQMRTYIYQARSLIGSDSSGLSDPFARVIIGDSTASTQVIDETLSPTWDELLVFNDITLFSTIEQIKADPPTIVIEIFDQDKVGKSEFIGRTFARPAIKAFEDSYEQPQFPPSLEWYEIIRGDDRAGELLATFELLEIPPKENEITLPELPSPKEPSGKPPLDMDRGPILPVPKGIRPTLSKYRIEVLFWGLRDLKRVHLLCVDKPRVDIECAGNIIYSTVIQNAKSNPNFNNPIKYVDVELPDQDLYRPPLTIRVVDCRSFGRSTLVGTHTINSINKYMYTPMTKREREIEERKKTLIPLQNIDLKANCIIQDDVFTIENEKERSPLLASDVRNAIVSYGSGARPNLQKRLKALESARPGKARRRKPSSDPVLNDDEGTKDWWTKYFASVEAMMDGEKASQSPNKDDIYSPTTSKGKGKRRPAQSGRAKLSPILSKKNIISRYALAKIYPHELEAVPDFGEFKDWLQTFELYRGKKTGDDTSDDNRVVGAFKGALKVYKWPLPKGIDDHTVMGFDPNHGFFQGVPSNEPIRVLVRVYVVKATDLHPMDLNGKADPYIVLNFGSKRISDKEHYVSKQLNPVFGKCFEIDATFPQDSMLNIQVLDWDLVGSDDLIGETKIDLENRFYSRHRATCGLQMKYEEQGFNRWRDAMKPTQILAKLCKDGKLDAPIYEYGRVKVGRTIFNMPMDDPELFSNPDTIEEQMALAVLHRWQEVPRVGTRLVPEHIETRPLYKPNKPGIEQGRLEMWVEMFPMDMPLPGPPMDISARRPKSYEMRVIIWNTDDVVLEDDAFFSGEKMSDIYVKGWLIGPDDCQSTDIHYRSLTGEGNFNWRFVYPFDYLEAEEKIVISRKESVFSWDETERKIPARLELQVWDADHFTTDDFLGAITLDLNRFPRGAKSSKLCTLEMLRNDGTVPMINIFKQKRVKGWWPFHIKRDTEEMELTGKVEAEIHLLTREEADKQPAGLGRSEPDPLEKPNRPDGSFMWILNPLKSLRYVLWHSYKWNMVRYGCAVLLAMFLLAIIFAVPGYLVKKLLGA